MHGIWIVECFRALCLVNTDAVWGTACDLNRNRTVFLFKSHAMLQQCNLSHSVWLKSYRIKIVQDPFFCCTRIGSHGCSCPCDSILQITLHFVNRFWGVAPYTPAARRIRANWASSRNLTFSMGLL